MGSGRFVAVAIALLVFSYAAVQWLVVVRPVKPDPRIPSFHRIDPDSPRTQVEASHASDMDSVRDRLRHALLDSAASLGDAPCSDSLKARYVKAASDYVHAWFSIAPCLAARCGSADERLMDRAAKAFGSPLDHRVHEAMQRAHETDALREGDFPKDVVRFVAELARDPVINPAADPKIRQDFREMRTPLSCRVSAR